MGINVECKRQGREEEERMIFYAFCDPVVRRESSIQMKQQQVVFVLVWLAQPCCNRMVVPVGKNI